MIKSTDVSTNSIALKDSERTRVETWTRVMGYHRPITAFNPGKQSEHAERLHFVECDDLCNQT